MTANEYSIAHLVADLKRITAAAACEKDILSQLRPLALRAAEARSSWLTGKMYDADEEQGFGAHILHEEPDHTLTVMAIAWLPDRGAPPHDHGTWAVIAGVDGPEKNLFYERVDDRSRPGHAELRLMGEKVCSFGDVLAVPTGMIHAVKNESDAVSVSLHIYGKHINYAQRSQYDVEARTERPFIIKMEA